ncbi:hypothetical protein CCP1ISM_110021 [Azospirillaceae bacterium]
MDFSVGRIECLGVTLGELIHLNQQLQVRGRTLTGIDDAEVVAQSVEDGTEGEEAGTLGRSPLLDGAARYA